MVHTRLFKITVLMYLMDCSYAGLFKIIALEICQTKHIPMLKMHSGRQGEATVAMEIGIWKINILCRN